jgi:23S rRNA (adenine2503-C2)-methyltransferase
VICKDIIKSEIDRTQKFILVNECGQVLEVSYIDKQDGKHILVVPTQANCGMACKFCHTTELIGKVAVDNLTTSDICSAVEKTLECLKLSEDKIKTLLVSYMGNGEPLINIYNVLESMVAIQNRYSPYFKEVRFAISTMMPINHFNDFEHFTEMIKSHHLNCKVHLSLHFTTDEQRKKWMPQVNCIKPTMLILQWYQAYTGNAIELHYTLIAGVNDSDNDIGTLEKMLKNTNISIKFLNFAPLKDSVYQPSQRVANIMEILQNKNIVCEFYNPPGRDVGASCGMFLSEYYLKYQKKDALHNVTTSTTMELSQ